MAIWDDQIAIATWGGVVVFDTITNSFTQTLTKLDGLSGNDVLAMYSPNNNELQLSINNTAVDRIINGKMSISLTTDLGLPSLIVNDFHSVKNLMFVANEEGLTVFRTDENFPFPLLLETFNRSSGHTFSSVNCITSDIDNYVYIGTNVGFSRVHADSLTTFSAWKNFTFSPPGLNERVNSIDIYYDYIAFGTSRRAMYFNKNDINWLDDSVRITPSTENIIDNDANFHQIQISQIYTTDAFTNRTLDFRIFAVCGSWNDGKSIFTAGSEGRNLIIYQPGFEKIVIRTGEDELLPRAATNILYYKGRLYATSWGDGLYQINIRSSPSFITHRLGSIHTNAVTRMAVDHNGKVWFSDGTRVGTPTPLIATGVSAIDTKNGRWETYKFTRGVQNQLLSNNINAIGVDSKNRKYFGSWWTSQLPNPYPEVWGNGYSVLDDSDPENPVWETFTYLNLTVTAIKPFGDKMWVLCDEGIRMVNEDFSIHNVVLQPLLPGESPGTNYPYWMSTFASSENHTVFGRYYSAGFWIWNHPSEPVTGGSHWSHTILTREGRVADIGVYQSENFTQFWAITPTSLILYDIRGNSRNWYQYNTDLKRRIHTASGWADSQWYFAGETRLWGSEVTTPTCLVVDPFGRVWVGTADKGITMYDIYEDRFYIFNEGNSPLVSNDILSMAYQGSTGLLWVGTKAGMMTMEIGKSEKTATTLGDVDVFPNPFRPDIHRSVTIQNKKHDSMPIGKNECRIFDMSGHLVRTLSENMYFEFEWDGNNAAGNKCSSGVYFFIIETEKTESARGKIVLIR
jgi:hypothetical protein